MTRRTRLLFVSHCFAPVLTPESIQNGRTLRALAEIGWDTTVLTVDERTVRGARDPRLLEVLPAGLPIVKAPSNELPFTKLRGLPIKLLTALGLPELHVFWYQAAVRAGLALVRERFDAMHSWSSYPTSNLVGLALRRATDLPWVVHFSDPWVDSPYFGTSPLRRAVVRRLERAVIGEADRVVFITEETRDLVMRKYPAAWREKAVVIAHGYMAEDVARARPSDGTGLTLTHAGSFYLGKREPYTLIAAVGRLQRERSLAGRLRLQFVGPTLPRYVRAAEEAGIGDIVTWTGPVSWSESQRLAESSDALVVIDAQSDGPSVFLPSKIVDYLSARKPILGLTPLEGATAALLRRLGCPAVDPDDAAGAAAAIRAMLEARERGPLELPAAYEPVADEYEIRGVTRSLDRALREAMDRRARAASRS